MQYKYVICYKVTNIEVLLITFEFQSILHVKKKIFQITSKN